MIKMLGETLVGWACKCFCLHDALTIDDADDYAPRFTALVARVANIFWWLGSVLEGQWFARLHEAKRATTEPLFSVWGLDHYPRGHVQEIARQHFEWGRLAALRDSALTDL